jgi:hypothetical protein
MLGSTPQVGVGGKAGFNGKPTDLAGCKLWLRADMGVTLSGANVTSWADQSPSGYVMTPPSTAPTKTSSYSPLGNQPAIVFAGGDGLLCTSGNPVAGASPRTLFVVYATTGSNTIFCLRTSTLKADYWTGTSGYGGIIYTDGVNNANNAQITPDDTTTGKIAEWASAGPGQLLTYKRTGVPAVVSQTAGSNTETGGTGFSLGVAGAGYGPFVGKIAEVALFDTQLSPPDATAVRTYMQTRYVL